MHLVNRLKHLVLEEIWDFPPVQLNRFRAFLYKQLKFFWIVGTGFRESQARLQALALSFKTLISLAPLLAVAFSVLKAFGVQNRLKPALTEALAPLGPKGEEVTGRLYEIVNNINVGALGFIGLIALFFTVLSLVGTIEAAFNQIWKVRMARPLARKFADYLSTLMIGPVLIFAALGITATLQNSGVVKTLLALEPFGSMLLFLLRLVPYLTVWAAFSFLYLFIPNTKVKLKSAMVGGVVGAVLWQTAGWAFAAFVATSTKYYAIYSSFAILLLFLLWIYYGWMILLFGAQVAFVHQNFRIYERERKPHMLSGASRERLAVEIMAMIGRNFYFKKPAWTETELAKELRVPHGLLEEILTALKERNMIVEVERSQLLFPARDLERIEIREILDCIRTQGDRNTALLVHDRREDPIAQLFTVLDESIRAALRGRTLKSLVLAMSDEELRKDLSSLPS